MKTYNFFKSCASWSYSILMAAIISGFVVATVCANRPESLKNKIVRFRSIFIIFRSSVIIPILTQMIILSTYNLLKSWYKYVTIINTMGATYVPKKLINSKSPLTNRASFSFVLFTASLFAKNFSHIIAIGRAKIPMIIVTQIAAIGNMILRDSRFMVKGLSLKRYQNIIKTQRPLFN